jgi:hypothetical protein
MVIGASPTASSTNTNRRLIMARFDVVEYSGNVLTYDSDDVADMDFSTPSDLIDETPPGATSLQRKLGQAHLHLSLHFKEGKAPSWEAGASMGAMMKTIMAEVSAFGVTAADPLNAVRLLIARVDDLEHRVTRPVGAGDDAERVARAFHEAYERLAPSFGYETREASARPWSEVPEQNRNLMVAVAGTLIGEGVITSLPGGSGGAGGVAQAFYEEGVRIEVEANPDLLKDDHADERPSTWEDLDEEERGFIVQVFEGLLATGRITDGLPTTGGTPVYDTTVAPSLVEHSTAPSVRTLVAERDALRDAQRPLVRRLGQLRTAAIAAREVAQMVVSAGSDIPTMDAAAGWVERFGKLADPPLDIEVEDDDDPADTPTEGEHWTKESSEPAGWPMTDKGI